MKRSLQIVVAILSLLPFTFGTIGGIFVLIALRVEYYELMGLKPNMAPQMA